MLREHRRTPKRQRQTKPFLLLEGHPKLIFPFAPLCGQLRLTLEEACAAESATTCVVAVSGPASLPERLQPSASRVLVVRAGCHALSPVSRPRRCCKTVLLSPRACARTHGTPGIPANILSANRWLHQIVENASSAPARISLLSEPACPHPHRGSVFCHYRPRFFRRARRDGSHPFPIPGNRPLA